MQSSARRAWERLERWSSGFGLRRKPWFTATAIFILCFTVFYSSKVLQLGDSYYSMLLGENLLRKRSFALDDYFTGPFTEGRHPGSRNGEIPYQIARVGDHLYYRYPPGTSILSIPFIAAFNVFGVSTIADDGGYDKRAERKIQRVSAAILTAAFAVLVYAMSRLLLQESWSVLVTLVTAFGTQVWSTASRALWSHTWVILLGGIVVYQLLAHATGHRKLRPMWLGTLAAWAYFVRPTALLTLVAAGLYLLVRERRAIPAFGATLAAWVAPFVGYSLAHFGSELPRYYERSHLLMHDPYAFWNLLAANLVSPARGLFIFVPEILLVAVLLVRYRATLRYRLLVWLALGVIGIHWVVVSRYGWWAGYSYGPRYMTDVLPWFALLAILAIRAWLDARDGQPVERLLVRVRLARALAVALIGIGIVVNAGGALTKCSARWSQYPYSVLDHPWRIWDWKDPQVLAWMHYRPKISLPAPDRHGDLDSRR